MKLVDKFGVDPENGGNYRMTSDVFFTQNYDLKFNVVFIDGLHTYEQCQKDCINALSFLKKNGIILFHDFLPKNAFEEAVPRKQTRWTGDVWKVAVELNNSKNLKFVIANIDNGVGILKKNENYEYKKIEKLKSENFKDYIERYYKLLPIVTVEKALEFIDK